MATPHPKQTGPPQDPRQHDGHPPVVYVTRPVEPLAPVLTEEMLARHEESKRKYPNLHLSDGEYVIFGINRHYIGLIEIWGFVILLSFMLLFGLTYYAANPAFFADLFLSDAELLPTPALVAIPVLIIIGLFALGGWIAHIVYTGNKFFLTNESVIQVIRTSLFSTSEQIISLGNVEDASYMQHGILQYLFNYGTLRLSTEGEETTYLFIFAPNPKPQHSKLNEAVEAFKMGRPVDVDET